MNSKLKGLIVCGVSVLCLAIVAIALTLSGSFKGKDDSSSESSPAPQTNKTITVMDFDKAQVKHILIENEYGEINITQTKLGEESWTVDELNGLKQADAAVSAAVNTAATLSAKAVAEEDVTDFSKYGLDSPTAKFTVELSDYDKTVKTFLIGNESPESGYRYICEEGGTVVYTSSVSNLHCFMNKPEYFVTLTLLETPSEESWPTIEDLCVERTDLDYAIKFRTEEDQTEGLMSAQVMYEPIYMSLDVTNSTDITHGMWGLSAEDAIKIFPTEEDLKTYGLDKPGTTVTLKTKEAGTYVLKIGNPIYAENAEGEDTMQIVSYYCTIEGIEGVNSVYQVSSENLPWATFLPENVISSLMTTNAVGTVSSVSFECGGTKQEFTLTADGDGDISEVRLNGENVDVKQFKTLYQQIITCPTNEVYFTEPEGELYATLSINLADGSADVIEFYTDTDRRLIVKLNGRTTFKIASSWVSSLSENIQNVKEGKDVKDFV